MPAFFTLDEIDQLLKFVWKHAKHDFIDPMFVFAAHTGARRSEMRRSKLDDFDFSGKRVYNVTLLTVDALVSFLVRLSRKAEPLRDTHCHCRKP